MGRMEETRPAGGGQRLGDKIGENATSRKEEGTLC